jgi:Ser/Thr protein kinase RdoA (MazF antagonist)
VAAAVGVPVPAPVASGWFDDRAVDVASWCSGRPVAAVFAGAREAGDAEAARQVCRRFGRTQAQLHAACVQERGLLPDAAGLLERAGCDPALRTMLAMVVDAEADSLLHMDYHPFNVLDDGHAVTGVVDWTNAAVGDPRFDLARTRSLFVLAHDLAPRFADLVPDLLTDWRAGYEQERPMPDDEELAPFLACAGGLLLADWRPRVAAGQASGRLLEVAAAWARTWHDRALAPAAGADRTEPTP